MEKFVLPVDEGHGDDVNRFVLLGNHANYVVLCPPYNCQCMSWYMICFLILDELIVMK